MAVNQDYKDLFKIFNAYKVRYLIVEAYAIIYYTEPRYTKDIDIWIEPSLSNSKKVWKALIKFGAPLKDIKISDFCNRHLTYKMRENSIF